MTRRWIWAGCIAAVGLAVTAAGPALARAKHQRAVTGCVAQPPRDVGVLGFLFNPAPEPNGCAPPVYVHGRYEGQDPDPFIRSQLQRDPQTGYRPF